VAGSPVLGRLYPLTADMGSRRKGRRRRATANREPKDRGKGADAPASDEARPGGLGEWIKSGVIALVIFVIIRFFIFQTFVITSGSMENTLLVGDFLVVNRAAIGSRVPLTDLRIPGYSEPRRGDILVFDPPHEDTLILVKRLVGMPGDTLEMRDKVLFLNGEAQDEPYIVRTNQPDYAAPEMLWQRDVLLGGPHDDYRPSRDTWGPIVVPPNRYFMLGDNRDTSLDGRTWGLLEPWRLEGRAVAIYFSYNRGSFLPFPWLREVRWGRIFDRVR